MASSVVGADWFTLGDRERVVWTGGPSYYPVVVPILIGLALAVFGVWSVRALTIPTGPVPVEPATMQALPLVLVPIGLLVGGWPYLRRWSAQYVLTTDGLYAKRGFLSRSVSQVRLDRVQNTSFNQSSLQRLLDYGDVLIYAAGSDRTDLALTDVHDPQGLSRTIAERLDQSTRRGAPESSTTSQNPAGDDRAVL